MVFKGFKLFVNGTFIGGCDGHQVILRKRKTMTAEFDLLYVTFKNLGFDALQYFEQWTDGSERMVAAESEGSVVEIPRANFFGFAPPKDDSEDEDEDEDNAWVENMAVVEMILTGNEWRYWFDYSVGLRRI